MVVFGRWDNTGVWRSRIYHGWSGRSSRQRDQYFCLRDMAWYWPAGDGQALDGLLGSKLYPSASHPHRYHLYFFSNPDCLPRCSTKEVTVSSKRYYVPLSCNYKTIMLEYAQHSPSSGPKSDGPFLETQASKRHKVRHEF